MEENMESPLTAEEPDPISVESSSDAKDNTYSVAAGTFSHDPVARTSKFTKKRNQDTGFKDYKPEDDIIYVDKTTDLITTTYTRRDADGNKEKVIKKVGRLINMGLRPGDKRYTPPEKLVPPSPDPSERARLLRPSERELDTRRKLACCLVFFYIFILAAITVTLMTAMGHSTSTKNPESDGGASFTTLQNALPKWLLPYQYDLDLLVDVDKGVFSGTVNIYTSIAQETDQVLFHSVGLNIQEAAISPSSATMNLTSEVDVVRLRYDNHNQAHTLQLSKKLQAGNYIIVIKYVGHLQKPGSRHGFFLREYDNKAGGIHRIAATHFETIGARFAYPCVDEPALKARFNINITAHQKFTVLSNSPEINSVFVNSTGDDDQPKWLKHVFDTTPPMATYLAAWIVGELDLLKTATYDTSDSVTVTVYSQLGRAFEGGNALSLSLDILAAYQQFAMPFPLKKLDMVPIPDFPFEGLKNLGLIIYDDGTLSVNSSSKTGN